MMPPLSIQRIVAAILIFQVSVALGLLLYLAAGGKSLVLAFAAPGDAVAEAGIGLLIPVAGVRPSELIDTYGAPRSGGRAHKGVDIFSPEGTAVLAAATGVIVGRDSSTLGGISIYKRDLDQRTVYFYGHLQRFRAGLKEGDLVRQGDVIGYVGQTGNVPPGSPHLHFSVYVVADPNRWWQGRDLNPCDLLPCGVPADGEES
jgi:peptidoglycan LD-endopeptidase LytH